MMPATQLKMLRYMQSSDPNGNGDDSDGGLSDSPKPSSRPATQLLNQPPPLLSARQQLAEAAKIPVPVPVRSVAPSHQTNVLSAVTMSPRKQQQPQRQSSFQRARPPPALSDQAQQQIWEESSINSMFAESVAASARPKRTGHGRDEGSFPQRRTQHYEQTEDDKVAREREPAGPLPMEDRGMLKMVPTNTAEDAAARADDPYVERPPYGSSARQVPALKHAKYALRDSRPEKSRPLSLDRPSFEDFETVTGASPEQRVRQREESVSRILRGGTAAPDARTHQSALFRDLELARSNGGAMTKDGGDALSQGDEETIQQTPRQHNQSPPKRPPPLPPTGAQQKRGLLESSVLRTAGGGGSRREKKTSRKRRNSLDYDDSALHSMSYTDLKEEPFDHDPTRAPVQQAAATPPKLSLEDRLVRHKNKDGNSQHRFFTEMSMHEWDESGDWFLEQFSELSNRIREKRQAKRKKVAEFEAEIAEREEMVRVKMESIDRTLGKLKHEGEGMMQGKVADI